jgi:hypothetical protein
MRKLILGLSLLSTVSIGAIGCSAADGPDGPPPVLKITSPARGTIQSGLDDVEVRGTVTAAPDTGNGAGLPVASVEVNGVPAQVAADGTFVARVPIGAGATMLHTVALDTDGNEALDTRTIEAGTLLPIDSTIDDAITAAISRDAFAKIGELAGNLIKATDLGALVQGMNPVVDSGDGPDCLYGQAFIQDLDMANATIELVPYAGGLQLHATIDGLDVPLTTQYAVACVDGDTDVRITADHVDIVGDLALSVSNGRIDVELMNPDVQLDNLEIDASGLPGTIIDMLSLDSAIQWIIPYAVDMFVGPMLNDAIAGMSVGPLELDILGQHLTMGVSPSAIEMTADGGKLMMDSEFHVRGSEASPGLVFTQNGLPSMDAGNGFQLAMADDAINQLMNGFWAVGAMNMTIPHQAGQFDHLKLEARLPPMMSASTTDGDMKLVIGDMMVTLIGTGVEQAKLAFNVEIAMQMESEGSVMKLGLQEPVVYIDTTDEIPNISGFTDDDLETIHHTVVGLMMDQMLPLLGAVPLPSFAGIQLEDISIQGKAGYVTISGALD